jgi:Xaa-Pro dipeptidase
VQWWRSERLTAAVIQRAATRSCHAVLRAPIGAETLSIPPRSSLERGRGTLELVADFLRERGVAAEPIGFEETDRYFILEQLKQQIPNPSLSQAIRSSAAAG